MEKTSKSNEERECALMENIAKDQSVILIELRIEYEDRKAPSIIRREEDQASIILVAMRVQ